MTLRATRSAEVYPMLSAISGTIVVNAEPVSSTSRALARPFGPTTTASMTIRSPSISKELSDLIGHHEPRIARERRVDLAGEVVAYLRVDLLPRARLLEGLASR